MNGISIFLGIGAAIYFIRKRNSKQRTIGAIQRAKRRVFAEVATAQSKGIDFEKKYPELSVQEKNTLSSLGNEFGWKQTSRSINSGKSYPEAYYNSLRRAYRQVSGIEGVGATYKDYRVRNATGDIVLIQRLYQPVIDHVQKEESNVQDKEQRSVEHKKTIQEQIIEDNPNLKVHDTTPPITSTDFNYVITTSIRSRAEKKYLYKNRPFMAFKSLSNAEKMLDALKLRQANGDWQFPRTYKIIQVSEYDPRKILGLA